MFWVKKEAFFNSLAEDSDICISFTAAFGGALTLELVMLGVMPLMNLCKRKVKIKAKDDTIMAKNLAIRVHLCFKEQYKHKTNIATPQERHLKPIKAVEL